MVNEIDRLLDQYTHRQIAAILNERSMRSGKGQVFTSRIVAGIQRRYHLSPRYDRLRKAGMLTVAETAALLGVGPQRVSIWARHGLLRSYPYNDKNDSLYEPPGSNPPRKTQGVKLSTRRPTEGVVSKGIKEVQCEA